MTLRLLNKAAKLAGQRQLLSRSVGRQVVSWQGIPRFVRNSSFSTSTDLPPSDISQELKESFEKSDTTELPRILGNPETHEFKASTKRLLNMVGKSLYSEKEIFVRELISNASDALEKRRYLQLVKPDSIVEGSEKPQIEISIDEKAKTLTFQDNGVGMTRDELLENLGVIASSGSKRFRDLSEAQQEESSKQGAIIGQFGVGFYSCFMVSDSVTVFTRSAEKAETSKGYCWTSDGQGSFNVSEADNVPVGTKIVIHLKESEASEYLSQIRLQTIIQKYSNFVGFPIILNKEAVNTIEPLWTKSPSSVTKDEHEAFFKFISHSWEPPQFFLHYKTDAPLSISAIFYVPSHHSEQQGYKRLEPGVSIYSRKVMIQPNSKAILPEWLRFVKGVVDSEDIPLNISRELLQDGVLISKLRRVLTQRIVKWFQDEAKRDEEAYLRFYKDFGSFLKEGIVSDNNEFKDMLVKCLRFDSSVETDPKTLSYKPLEDVASKSPEKTLYFLSSTSRVAALDSPYLEPFINADIPVVLAYDPMDEFVFNAINEFNGRKLVNVETMSSSDLEPILAQARQTGSPDGVKSFSEEEQKKLFDWIKNTLQEKSLQKISATVRPTSTTPAFVTSHMSASMRRLLSMSPGFREAALRADDDAAAMFSPHSLELNVKSPIIERLFSLYESEGHAEEAKLIARQIYDNARLAASIVDDPRSMLKQLNSLVDSYSKIVAKKAGTVEAPSVSDKVSMP